ncbi:MAG: PAS domain S-box protein [Deltaproteobacteria bacterium]|nr:PAS domain S-box protein [Deltaproteobacteria bacterium]
MIKLSKNSSIGFVGGGNVCRSMLKILLSKNFSLHRPAIVGVADINSHAVGMHYARRKGIFTTSDYNDLYTRNKLNLIIEVTGDALLLAELHRTKPAGVKLIDHFEAMSLWDFIQIEEKKEAIQQKIRKTVSKSEAIEKEFEKFSHQLEKIVGERTSHLQTVEKELVAREQTLSQIVQGTAIPTFVITEGHTVSHWNRALEKLAGIKADEIIGTSDQWKPFYTQKRPTMADIIVDRQTEEEIKKYYGDYFWKSALIDGAYESEDYWPELGSSGTWLFFTASPIKGPDGRIVGAIETLLDITERKRAEEQLRKETDFITSIIQSSPAFFVAIDSADKILMVNETMLQALGYTPEEVIGKTYVNTFVPQAHQKRVLRVFEKIIKTKKPTETENYLIAKDGHQVLVEWHGRPVFKTTGEFDYFFGVGIDITAKKLLRHEREKQIRQLQALWAISTALSPTLNLDESLRTAVDGIISHLNVDSAGIYLRDEAGKFALAYSSGYTQTFLQKNHTAEADGLVARVFRTGQSLLFEDISTSRSPHLKDIEREGLQSAAYFPLASKTEVIGVLRVSSHTSHHFIQEEKDVLELIGNLVALSIENAILRRQEEMFSQSLANKVREKTEELEKYYRKLRRSEERYRLMFDADPNPIFILDLNTYKIMDVNTTAIECYGYSRDEFLTMAFPDLQSKNDDDDESLHHLKKISLGQSYFYPKRIHRRKTGGPFYVNVHIRAVKFMEREWLLVTTTDITENVETEAKLIQAGKMATLGTMASGIAHEINQPLNVIQVCADYFAKMVKRGETICDKDLHAMAEEMRTNVQRAAQIIRHMKDFARQAEVKTHEININKPIRDVFKILGQQLRVHGIEITLDLNDTIPPILGDYNRLEQVFVNLVTNAMDALDERGQQEKDPTWKKELRIKSLSKSGAVIVTVSDNGTGIPDNIKDKIFEPFFTTKKVGKGTGLGTSISYGIIKDYGGSIDVKSSVGVGTTFEIKFPAVHP